MLDQRAEATKAHVYVIGHDVGPQKVGFTHDLSFRLKCLQRQEGNKTLAVFTSYEVPYNQALRAERMAHWLLRDKMVRTEWFDVTPEEAAEAVRKATSYDYGATDAIPPIEPRGRVLYPEHVMARLPKGTRERIAAVTGSADRADFIRQAVAEKLTREEDAREIKRREKAKG